MRGQIGSPSERDTGAAYLYTYDGAAWTLTERIVPTAGSSVASAVALAPNGQALLAESGGDGLAFVIDLDGPSASFCTSLPNSAGGAATLESNGCGSVSANDLALRASPVPDTPGVFFYGTLQIQAPFGNGFRCVGGATTRSPFVFGSGGQVSWPPDLSAPRHHQITAGST